MWSAGSYRLLRPRGFARRRRDAVQARSTVRDPSDRKAASSLFRCVLRYAPTRFLREANGQDLPRASSSGGGPRKEKKNGGLQRLVCIFAPCRSEGFLCSLHIWLPLAFFFFLSRSVPCSDVEIGLYFSPVVFRPPSTAAVVGNRENPGGLFYGGVGVRYLVLAQIDSDSLPSQ